MWRDHISKFKLSGRSVFAALIAVPISISAPIQVQAGGWDPGTAAIVGVIGGLALGSALADHRHGYGYDIDPYYPRGRVVYYPRHSYYYDDEPSCYRVRERVWVPGYGWDYRRLTLCD